MVWDATQYLKFEGFRTRPAYDLLQAVPLASANDVIDLGCGTGTSTALLAARFPKATICGLDNSPEMLAKAKQSGLQNVTWAQADAGVWAGETGQTYDLIFSNALLHWVGAHETILPQLMDRLNSGGVLAVQMPRNFHEPSHRLVSEVLGQIGQSGLIPSGWVDGPVGHPAQYDAWLRGAAGHRQIWTTTYYHQLEGADPVYNWIKGTALRPILAALDDDQTEAFETRLCQLLQDAYPVQDDGTTLFPFTRLFIVATRP